MKPDDGHDAHRVEARKRWGNLTAFRLGYVAGENGQVEPNPYLTDRGRRQYLAGVAYGRERARAARPGG
jgi:hypothetical protein